MAAKISNLFLLGINGEVDAFPGFVGFAAASPLATIE